MKNQGTVLFKENRPLVYNHKTSMNKSSKSVTLTELLISLVIIAIMVLSFFSLVNYGHQQVTGADRKAKVQNEIVNALEHMTKYVQMANGNISNRAIELTAAGFRVRVDFRNPQIPSDLNNGAWVRYSLVGNSLSTNCTPYGVSGTCGSFISETLSTKIITFNPTLGAVPLNNNIEIDLVGRYYPTQLVNKGISVLNPEQGANPQVTMKTKIICNNASTN